MVSVYALSSLKIRLVRCYSVDRDKKTVLSGSKPNPVARSYKNRAAAIHLSNRLPCYFSNPPESRYEAGHFCSPI